MKKEKTGHTPGPWLVMGNQRNGHIDYVLPMADDKDFQANCRLIAAAPELLAVLESARIALSFYSAEMTADNPGKSKTYPFGITVEHDARAVIAKARGEV